MLLGPQNMTCFPQLAISSLCLMYWNRPSEPQTKIEILLALPARGFDFIRHSFQAIRDPFGDASHHTLHLLCGCFQIFFGALLLAVEHFGELWKRTIAEIISRRLVGLQGVLTCR